MNKRPKTSPTKPLTASRIGNTNTKRSTSPLEFKAIRSQLSHECTPTAVHLTNSDKRAIRRSQREALNPHHHEIVDRLMSEFNSGKGRMFPVNIQPDRYIVPPNGSWSSALPNTPNSRLGNDILIPSKETANAFGTSQLQGCQGDFCSTDIRLLEDSTTDLGNFSDARKSLNQFRSKLLREDEFYVPPPSATSSNKANLNSMAIVTGKPVMIPYRMIIQTRQEMPLAKLALERHRRGEVGDYVSEDSYSDLANTAKLPSVFYKDVVCCENCHKIYSLIDNKRIAALAKLAKKRDEKKENKRPMSEPAESSGIKHNRKAEREKEVASMLDIERSDLPRPPWAAEYDGADTSLKTLVRLVDGLTKLDIAEIRTMVKPPAAVEIVLEAVMILLTGKILSYQDIRKLMGSGESFLLMLREFKLHEVTDERLQMIEPYVDNPVFKPKNVMSVSSCAAKFCGWVLGVVQAARWHRGIDNKRYNLLQNDSDIVATTPSNSRYEPNSSVFSSAAKSVSSMALSVENLTFVQKLEKRKVQKQLADKGKDITRDGAYPIGHVNVSATTKSQQPNKFEVDLQKRSLSPPKIEDRAKKAMMEFQKKTANRLASDNKNTGNISAVGELKQFCCPDGITRMSYICLGGISFTSTKTNLIIIHDFYDTCDATAIFFKPIAMRHDGVQIFCFNYPGQANTTWARPSAAERARGAKDPNMNNDWVADRLHELLQYAESAGDILLTNKFHLVGIGNGACIASSFLQRWGNHDMYASSVKSLVVINGFLYPDPQLSSILHSATQVFESTPHTRPDIPISYWSRFLFSEDYLNRVNPNLALNILTAVSNPITSEGRMKISKACLQHRDLRLSMSPEHLIKAGAPSVPVVLLQSTENQLVNASNVDTFLTGRKAKHLWSHQQNVLSEGLIAKALDPTSRWVGKLSSGPSDYSKYSTLGPTGLRLLLDTLSDERGAFVMWTRAGHVIQQENKPAVLDLFDALCCADEVYFGIASAPDVGRFGILRDEPKDAPRMEVIFKITAPKKAVVQDEQVVETTPLTPRAQKIEDSYNQPNVVDIREEVNVTPPALQVSTESSENVKEEEEAMRKASENFTPTATSGTTSIPSWERRASPVIMAPKQPYPEPNTARSNSTLSLNNLKPGSAGSPLSQHSPTANTEAGSVHNKMLPTSTLSPGLVNSPPGTPEKACFQSSSTAAAKTKTSSPGDITNTSSNLSPKTSGRRSPSSQRSSPSTSLRKHAAGSNKATTSTAVKEKESTGGSKVLEKTILETTPIYLSAPIPQRVPQAVPTEKAYELQLEELESTKDQRKAKKWAEVVPDVTSSLELEAELNRKHAEFIREQERLKEANSDESSMGKIARIKEEQERRRKQYEEEDNKLLAQLEAELEARRKQRLAAEKQRRLELQDGLETLVSNGIIEQREGLLSESNILREMPPMIYDEPIDIPIAFTESKGAIEEMDKLEDAQRRLQHAGKGISMEEFEKVQNKMINAQIERAQKLRHLGGEEQHALYIESAKTIQRVGRGYNGRKRAQYFKEKRDLKQKLTKGIITAQALMRGVSGRKRFEKIKKLWRLQLMRGAMIELIQRVFRGYKGRVVALKQRRRVRCRDIQRCFRGKLGRDAFKREKKRMQIIQKKNQASSKIQSIWRMKIAKEEFRSMRIHVVAANEIQRVFRGFLGRKMTKRRRDWSATEPGPERIKLGLKLIEESKLAFERQEEEIEALHRAQARVEARVSHIYTELKDNEKELLVLEREMKEIDTMERDLATLTHQRELLLLGVKDAAGMPGTALPGNSAQILGHEPELGPNDGNLERRRKAEAYALEMTIQIKRAEREKKRTELESEFAVVFQEVDKKKKALTRLENSLADMEATRERKDREFRRLQKNLMQLLLEQKQELDDLREKGIELETATATTAAAATATAMKAKEHDERSKVMFSQTEELMKFQFMSMSLSYFSSLNMLKQLRDMNADTTSAAISSSADAAASAAAAATAANLPNLKQLDLGANDFVELSIQKKKGELKVYEQAEKQTKKALAFPLPDHVRLWTCSDVCRWLETLSLNQYCPSFREASVDGPFLMELREEDLTQILGVRHKLHVRKILVSREKLKTLTVSELQAKKGAEHEEKAAEIRNVSTMPEPDAVFSQARNGRGKRLEESLNQGFPIDAEDERGDTLLMIACQNSNKRIVEMLIIRGANINHQNSAGNTPLHFALAFDREGLMGEYLIEHGADDSIENLFGLTPYDGIVQPS